MSPSLHCAAERMVLLCKTLVTDQDVCSVVTMLSLGLIVHTLVYIFV